MRQSQRYLLILMVITSLLTFFEGRSSAADKELSEEPPSEAQASSQASSQAQAETLVPVRASAETSSHQEFWLGRWYEDGVENRLQADYFGTWKIGPILSLEVGTSFSILQQGGPDLFGFAAHASFPNAKSDLTLAVQHERWPDWQVTENRAEFYWSFHPSLDLNLSFGVTYRAPLFGKIFVVPFLDWGTDGGGEISILYQVEWRFLKIQPFQFSIGVWNYDHMRLFTPDNAHFTLKASWELNPDIHLLAAGTVGVQGVSGAILSWPQSILSIGMTYDL